MAHHDAGTGDENALPGRFVSDRTQRAEVCAIVVTYNSAKDILLLLDGLRMAAERYRIRVVVVDNNSADETRERVAAHSDVILIESPSNRGYAAGINLAMGSVGISDYVLILNPDLTLTADTVTNLLAAAGTEGVGAVVPLILNADGTVECSVRNEPALLGNLLDAVLTARVASRLGLPSEGEYREHFYRESRDVAWATGAAILIPLNVAREVGDWNETFFLYAEETDFLRRIRERNLAVRFEPSAVVKHRGAGSGSSIELAALMAVNRVRYVEMHHGRFYAVLYRASVLLGHGIRSASAIHRYALSTVFRRRRWRQLPGLREMEAADLGYRRLHRVPSGDGRQAPGR